MNVEEGRGKESSEGGEEEAVPKALKGLSPSLIAKIRAKEVEKKKREAAEAAVEVGKKAAVSQILAAAGVSQDARDVGVG